ncbi:MAG: DNA polymerase III subunit alpha [Thermodesulfobacteriota bacterium]
MIPLTLRSHYSLMWGVSSPEEICRRAGQLGYLRLALTDTDNLYGLWPFLKACRRNGLAPIVGVEVTDPSRNRRAVCLVKNAAGYGQLCRLITERHRGEDFDLAKAVMVRSEGLVVLTRHPDLLELWRNAGISVAIPLPRRPGAGDFQLRRLARRLEIPVVATPGAFFLHPHDNAVHRLLRAIQLRTTLPRLTQNDTAPADAFLAEPSEYSRRFAAWPEAVTAGRRLAEELAFTGPDFGLVMPPWIDPHGRSAAAVLREAAYKGARRRYGNDLPETVVDRLEHELAVIDRMGFSSYFLVVRDIVRRSPRICGRGSGAASLVAYVLGITNVCPVKHNLYFERFLNPGRKDPPDIDIDFAWDERDQVLASVLKQYDGHAAMVCNHVLFQPRMAIREVAKVHGLTDTEISRITRRLPWYWRSRHMEDDLLTQLRQVPEMKATAFPAPWPDIIRLARRLIGIPRYLSVHSGGMVITPEPIAGYVPVQTAPKGVPIIQWEKDAAEESGLVKIDLLGNRSLGVIRDAVAGLRENGVTFDESRWEPEDDPVTRDAVARGDTMGCFYIESPATRQLQKKAKVGDFEHIVIHSSIIRPAANAFIREYLRRLHGASWNPIHPLLADVLEETYGIMVYQEDVAKAAVVLAGFSHAEADGLRKIISKKDKVLELDDYRIRFFDGARSRGLTDEQLRAVWEMILSFGGYSFCKPHSASYARVSFQSAFLKARHPAEFMAAVISNQGGFYNTCAYVSEARRMGLTILHPDVNHSRIRWQGRGKHLRVGLQSVKNLGAGVQRRILENRQTGPYETVTDFLERVRPDDIEVRALIHSGALDALRPGASHADLSWEVAVWRDSRNSRLPSRDLFHPLPGIRRPVLPPDDGYQRLRREYEVLGFLCSFHPMSLYKDRLPDTGLVKAMELGRHAGRRIRFAGLLITGKVVRTRHDEPMEFLTFEDETGLVETTFFPETYRRFCALLDRSRPYILSGRVEEDFGALTLNVSHVTAVSKFSQPALSGIHSAGSNGTPMPEAKNDKRYDFFEGA